MLIVTAKLPKRKLALGVAAAALLCCALLVQGMTAPAAQPVGGLVTPSTKGVKSNQDRIEFLQVYGWRVEEEPSAIEEIVIPKEMDESYQNYLALQKDQGFTLEDYRGKRVKRYSYQVTNYPTGEEGVQANLLIYRNRVVGGEILSHQLDGFLHGLAMP